MIHRHTHSNTPVGTVARRRCGRPRIRAPRRHRCGPVIIMQTKMSNQTNANETNNIETQKTETQQGTAPCGAHARPLQLLAKMPMPTGGDQRYPPALATPTQS